MTRIFSGGDPGVSAMVLDRAWRHGIEAKRPGQRCKSNTCMVKVLNMREVDGKILVYVTVSIYNLFTSEEEMEAKLDTALKGELVLDSGD